MLTLRSFQLSQTLGLCLRISVFVCTSVLPFAFLNVFMDRCVCACVSQRSYGLLRLRLCFSAFVWTLVFVLVFSLSVFVWTLVLVLVFLSVCMDSCACTCVPSVCVNSSPCACVCQCFYGLLSLRLRFSVRL